MPLLMPYYLDYDLLLLAFPAVLFASEMLGVEKKSSRDKWLVGLWIGLFVLLMFPSFTRILQFSLIVPCLAGIAALQIIRACKPNIAIAIAEKSDLGELSVWTAAA